MCYNISDMTQKQILDYKSGTSTITLVEIQSANRKENPQYTLREDCQCSVPCETYFKDSTELLLWCRTNQDNIILKRLTHNIIDYFEMT
jgi:hypothetical protein